MDFYTTPVEFKFVGDASTGEFEGYGAVFGSRDSHDDLILPGAFAASLAKRNAERRSLPMYVQHGPHVGGDHLPAGVWKSAKEDDHGLHMVGQIAGMDTERGKVIHSLVKAGALDGLSIEFNVPKDGATFGSKAGEPKRTIKTANLQGVSLVADPSHAMARVNEIKSEALQEFRAMMRSPDVAKATAATAAAMELHRQTLTGSNSPNADERAQLFGHMRDAHEALTGSPMPVGMKFSAPQTLREFETFLREECKFSHAQARFIAENGFKSSLPRDEEVDPANTAAALLRALQTD